MKIVLKAAAKSCVELERRIFCLPRAAEVSFEAGHKFVYSIIVEPCVPTCCQ